MQSWVGGSVQSTERETVARRTSFIGSLPVMRRMTASHLLDVVLPIEHPAPMRYALWHLSLLLPATDGSARSAQEWRCILRVHQSVMLSAVELLVPDSAIREKHASYSSTPRQASDRCLSFLATIAQRVFDATGAMRPYRRLEIEQDKWNFAGALTARLSPAELLFKFCRVVVERARPLTERKLSAISREFDELLGGPLKSNTACSSET